MPTPTPTETPPEYILEWTRGPQGTPYRAMIIPNVSSFDRTPHPADETEFSIRLDRLPLMQSAGLVTEDWSFRGMSGEEPREVSIFDRSVAGADASTGTEIVGGVEAFQALLAFLRDYEDDKKRYQSAYSYDPARAPKMVVRALREGLAFYCDKIQITPASRVGSSRMSYEYELTLETHGEARAEPYRELVNDPVRALPLAERQARDALRKLAAQRAADADAARALAEEAPSGSLLSVIEKIPGDLAQLRAPVLTFGAQVSEALEAVEAAVVAGIGFPIELAANIAHYAERASSAVYRLWDALDRPLRDRGRQVRDQIRRAVRSIGRAAEKVLGTAGAKTEGPDDTQIVQATTPRARAVSGQFVRLVRLLPGQDLAGLAERWLGSAERWREIRALNGLTGAWALPDGRALEPGVALWVPLEGSAGARPSADPADVYGTDLRWDFRRHDIIASGDDPHDFDALTGHANLRQALIRRATVQLGSCPVFRGLGILADIGASTSPERAALRTSQIATQYSGDDRIRRIREMRVLRYANTYTARLVVEGVAGDTVAVGGIGVPAEG